jgi:hypothetical protein
MRALLDYNEVEMIRVAIRKHAKVSYAGPQSHLRSIEMQAEVGDLSTLDIKDVLFVREALRLIEIPTSRVEVLQAKSRSIASMFLFRGRDLRLVQSA